MGATVVLLGAVRLVWYILSGFSVLLNIPYFSIDNAHPKLFRHSF